MRVSKYLGAVIKFLVYQFHLLNLAKTAFVLGFQIFFWKFGVSLGPISTHLGITMGIWDRLF